MSPIDKWPGGYIHKQRNGAPLFIIRRKIRGQLFHLSTRCHSLRAAMKELERFESDPAHYQPGTTDGPEPVFMTAERVLAFRKWQLASGVSRKHANSCKNRLAAWVEDLGDVDLRKANLRDHIKPALDRRRSQRSHRISTLKAFYAWLRKEEHVLISAEDPTLDLPVPQARPEKFRRRKAIPFENVEGVAPYLEQHYRDFLQVLAATGWHVTELERLIKDEGSAVLRVARGDTIGVLVTRHKGGEMTRTPVTDERVLEAATRLRDRGRIPKRPNAALRAACAKAGIPIFTVGVLRHSVATWSIEAGAIPALVSEFLGHKDPRTTKRFYADVHVPTVNVPLPKLKLVKS